jgi:alcohol dehydrogenase
LTHQLGGRYRLDHGVLSGIVLPPCVEWVQPAVPDAVTRLGALLADGKEAAPFIRSLVVSLGRPERLRDVGVPREELPAVAIDVMSDLSVRHSARPVTGPEELATLLDACW